jgi:hypothetical protein
MTCSHQPQQKRDDLKAESTQQWGVSGAGNWQGVHAGINPFST